MSKIQIDIKLENLASENTIVEKFIVEEFEGMLGLDYKNIPCMNIDNKIYYIADDGDNKSFFYEIDEPEFRSEYFSENDFFKALEVFKKFHEEGEGVVSIPE